MNLYQSVGVLALGSRLRRLSEAFLSEINKAYLNKGLDFDASWFPVFYLLSKNDALSIKELSDQIEVSHPAASQLISNLKNRELVTTVTCVDDGRKQLVTLTSSGRQLLTEILPMWEAISEAMEELILSKTSTQNLLPIISSLEDTFRSSSLSSLIVKKLDQQTNLL
jgi:DNA-binding MarR family transcriptional regulator